jgi:hypothetical protein
VRLSQFQELLQDEFGEFSAVLLSDLRLTSLEDKTPAQALSEGLEPRDVWLAICQHQNVPKERWHGKPKKPRHAD